MKLPRWRTAATAALVAGLLAALSAGCGSTAAPGAAGAPAAGGGSHVPQASAKVLAEAKKVACPALLADLSSPVGTAADGRQRVPNGVKVVAVVECVQSTVTVKGKGTWLAELRRMSTVNLDSLVTALRRPSAHTPAGTICPMYAIIVPWFVLITENGQQVLPMIPTVACGQPAPQVLGALGKLRWQTISQILEHRAGSLTPVVRGVSPSTRVGAPSADSTAKAHAGSQPSS
jgi:hypothetical protein